MLQYYSFNPNPQNCKIVTLKIKDNNKAMSKKVLTITESTAGSTVDNVYPTL